MVGLASLAAIARVAVQWSCSVLVLLVVGAFLAEASPPSASGARAVNSPVEDDSQHNSSAGKRCDLSVVCAAYAEETAVLSRLDGGDAHGARLLAPEPSAWNRISLHKTHNDTLKRGEQVQ